MIQSSSVQESDALPLRTSQIATPKVLSSERENLPYLKRCTAMPYCAMPTRDTKTRRVHDHLRFLAWSELGSSLKANTRWQPGTKSCRVT